MAMKDKHQIALSSQLFNHLKSLNTNPSDLLIISAELVGVGYITISCLLASFGRSLHCKNMRVALTNLGYLSCNRGHMVCYGIPLEIHGEAI